MNFEIKFKLCLWKGYFEKGMALTIYLRYMLIFFGLTSTNVKLMLSLGIIWGLTSFILGFLWFKYGWINAEQEVSNRFNLFVGEVRKKLINTQKQKL
jgi:hypothetical protein